MLRAFIVINVFLILTFTTDWYNDNSENKLSASPFNYETITAPPGQYILNIPINNFSNIEYIKKHVSFKAPFRIGKFEVSNKQWDICYKKGGCSHPALKRPGETDENPVVRVNWHDAYEFSEWLSSISDENYRLPTEEEWVYAAYMGKDHREQEVEYDYSSIQSIKENAKVTKKIGSYNNNAWGFSDYHGNVWEWTLSCWYSSEENILKKASIQELNSPEACTTRIAQGENRSHIPDFIFDTYNGGCATLRPAANLGFRLVVEAKSK